MASPPDGPQDCTLDSFAATAAAHVPPPAVGDGAVTLAPAPAPAPAPATAGGWRRPVRHPSLPEVHSSIRVSPTARPWRKVLAFAGPGLMVAVGYMDPGNWATDLAGGAQFGYTLLSVILISNFMAILLQHLSLKLGVVTGRDLAQACRDHYSAPVSFGLWILCEVAIAACDLAEVIGSAIALQLLFGVPLVVGVVITALDVLLILALQSRGFRALEIIVATLIVTIGGCFAYEMAIAQPVLREMLAGLIPASEIVTNPAMLYIAIGILGATVMPHNLYLHSSIVQTRAFSRDEPGKRMAIHYATIDSTAALLCAFFINAAILILAAAAFHGTEHENVADIHDAYKLLTPVLGAGLASTLFAIALLASGQNSTITGTLAGQIVMEGFLNIRLRPWLRRMITRLVAIVPAVIVAALYGEKGVGQLLVLSQVVLSLQLSFAVFPLVLFTADRQKMGVFVNPGWLSAVAWVVAIVIGGLNAYLLVQTILPWASGERLAMYATILVPLENSPADETILQHLRPLARLMGSRLILVHVADGFVARHQEQLNLEDSDEIRQDRTYLERRRDELAGEGFEVSTHLLCGEPAREIAALAEKEHCDLIAMCTHGHRFLQDVVRGSVASEVRHLARIPVLLVRMKREP